MQAQQVKIQEYRGNLYIKVMETVDKFVHCQTADTQRAHKDRHSCKNTLQHSGIDRKLHEKGESN